MVLNIIFSYNRAMQLDYLLKSVIARFKIDYKVVVIYHTSGEHKEGYDFLKNKYQEFAHISFVERKKLFFDISFIKTLSTKSNRKFFFNKNFLKPNSDNFKSLVQSIINNSDCEFVMFNTDDGFYFEDVVIEDKIFQIIRENPDGSSYRMYVGENLDGQPPYVKNKGEYSEWDYYAEKNTHHWTFPFSVDGTIYHSEGLLKHLKKVAFHNPITLEDSGVRYVIKNKLFKIGLSPRKAFLLVTKLNRVSVDTFNPTIQIDPKFLNQKFLEGYILHLSLPSEITNANVVPLKITLVKGLNEEVIYTLDDEGEKMQNLLGIEGAKKQMR